MADLSESAVWQPVYQLERNDPLDAGINGMGIVNAPHRANTNRTAWLRSRVEALEGTSPIQQASFQLFRQAGIAALCQGRLTLLSGTPVPGGGGLTARTQLFWTPFGGDTIALFNVTSNAWEARSFTEITLNLAPLAANTNFDIFIFDSGGLQLEAIAWANSGAGTSARSAAGAVSARDGILVKTSDSRRYLGTIRTTAVAGQCEDTDARRFVWNQQNRVFRRAQRGETATYTYALTTWRRGNNNATSRIDFVTGFGVENLQISGLHVSTAGIGWTDFAINNDTTPIAWVTALGSSVQTNSPFGFYQLSGYNYVQHLERSWDGSTVTFQNPGIFLGGFF